MTDEITPIEVPDQDEPDPSVPLIDDGDLLDLLRGMRALKLAKAALEADIKARSILLVSMLEKGARFTDDNGDLIEALVGGRGGKVKPDLSTLKLVDPLAYELVTTPKLDVKKLRRALQAGQVSGPALGCFRTEPTDPFIRMTNLSQEEPNADQDQD